MRKRLAVVLLVLTQNGGFARGAARRRPAVAVRVASAATRLLENPLGAPVRIPEPGTASMLAIGALLVAAGAVRRRQ